MDSNETGKEMEYLKKNDKNSELLFTLAQLQLSAASRRAQMQGNSDQFYAYLTSKCEKQSKALVEDYCDSDVNFCIKKPLEVIKHM